MARYAFYAAFLQFVAARTDRSDERVGEMMAELDRLHVDFDPVDGKLALPADRLRGAARALAGVAGFLQQHILPEVVAAGNAAGETQIRWVIDQSMTAVAELTSHAEVTQDAEPYTIRFPDPPG